jgi:hypothetical protein
VTQIKARKPTTLSVSCHRNLTSYAAAATAAGVSVLALATPSAAEVVYTPVHVSLRLQTFGEGTGYKLDLNGDGIADFELINSTFGNGGHALAAPAARGNQIVGAGIYASALNAGANIGPDGPFAHAAHHATWMQWWLVTSGPGPYSYGPWKDAINRYMGVKFSIGGTVHFGWARLSTHFNHMILTGYAYETVAGKPITAGDQGGDDTANTTPENHFTTQVSASLGHLAQGAAGLVAWRRD